MSKRANPIVGRILRGAVTLVFLGFLLSKVDFHALANVLAGASWLGLVGALLTAALAYPLLGLRFHRLLRTTGLSLTHGAVQALTWIGQFFNSFLPGATGGDLARLYYLWKDHEGRRSAAVIALVADRLVGAVVLMAAGTAAFLAIDPVGIAHTSAVLASVGGIVVALLGIVLLRTLHRFNPTGKLGNWIDSALGPGNARSIRESGQLIHADIAGVLIAIGLTAAAWILEFTAGWIAARSLGIDVGWATIAAGMAIAYTAAAVPVSIGGHGVREATLVFALSAAGGFAPTQSGLDDRFVGLALVLLSINVACSVAGGIVHVAWGRERQTQRPEPGRTTTSKL